MAGALRLDVSDENTERIHVVGEVAAPRPIEIAGQPLAEKFMFPRARQRSDMRIGQMGKP